MANQITVRFGVNQIVLAAEDTTLDTLRNRVKSLLNLAGNEQVMVNGKAAPAGYHVTAGDDIEFVKQAGAKGASVTVKCGVNEMNLDFAGQSVSTVRARTASLIQIPDGAKAEVNGRAVNESYVLSGGDTLEFVKQAGAKGVRA